MLTKVLLTLLTTVTAAGLWAVPSPAEASGGTPYSWTGGGDGHSWGDSSNWSPPTGTPGQDAGDSATIGVCASIDGAGATLTDLTVSVPGTGSCSIHLTGTAFTITGSLLWNGGEIDTPINLLAGSTSQISGGSAHTSTLDGTLDVAGDLSLSDLQTNSPLFIINPEPGTPSGIHIESSGTLMGTSDAHVTTQACCVNPVPVVNDGTIGASGGTLTLSGVALQQNHVVNMANDATLASDFGTVTSPGGSYTGSGTWRLQNNATATMHGTQTLGTGFSLELGGAAPDIGAHLGGKFTVAGPGTLAWTGGQLEANLTIAAGATLDAEGAHPNNGNRVLDGRDFTADGAPTAKLVNHGTVKLGGGAVVTTWDAAELDNESDGTVTIAPGSGFASSSCCVNPARIVNAGGTVAVPAVSGAPTTATIDGVAYDATGGTTTIAGGRTLVLSGGARGLLNATTVDGTGTLAAATPVSDSGTVTVSGQTTVDLRSGGSLDGTARLSGAGAFTWTGGNVSGDLTVATGSATVSGTTHKILATVNGGSQTSTLRFSGKTTFPSGTLLDLDRSFLTFAGTTTLRNGVQLSQGGGVTNTGHLIVDPGKGGTVAKNFNGSLTNRGRLDVRSGTFALSDGLAQSKGTLEIAKGAAVDDTALGPFPLTGGTLAGEGTFEGTVVNQGGSVAPAGGSIGRLTIAGDYTQASDGRLDLGFKSAKAFDLLRVTGTATLHGRASVDNDKDFRPGFGSRHTVVAANAAAGSLGCVTTTGGGTKSSGGRKAGHWAATVTAGGLRLTWKKGAKTHC